MKKATFRAALIGIILLAPALGGADGGCSPVLPIGEDTLAFGGAGGETADPITCGSNTCAAGEVCCNPSCGVCAAPGEGCTLQECNTQTCADTTSALHDLIDENRTCDAHTDCTVVNVSCLAEANCTGNFYVNTSLDQDLLAELTRDLYTCLGDDPDVGCPVCLRGDPPPACIDNVCQGAQNPPPGEAPCSGKACGEGCSNCVGDQPCPEILEFCDGNGVCGGPAACTAPDDPCAGKACGEPCDNCVPGEPCLTVETVCDVNGACGSGLPRCR